MGNLTYIAGTATSLGLPEHDFSLWAGEEIGSGTAYSRSFSSDTTPFYQTGRDISDIQAMCLDD